MASTLSRRTSDGPDDDSSDGKMGFLDHLDELRTRIIRSLIAIAAGGVVAVLCSDRTVRSRDAQ